MARAKLSPEQRALSQIEALGYRLNTKAGELGASPDGQTFAFYADTLLRLAEMGRTKAPGEVVVRGPCRPGVTGMILAVVPTGPQPRPSLRLVQGGRADERQDVAGQPRTPKADD